VEVALERQRARLADTGWRRNAHIPAGALAGMVPLRSDAHEAWADACRVRRLTGRGAARIRRVARTLADLDDREWVSADDVVRASWLREDVW
jgi:magnesium chelatase family protein